MKFGEKLKKHRKSIGLSQEELSKKLNISRQSISKWEQDKSLPDLVNSNILCKELNIKIEDILNSKDTNFGIDNNRYSEISLSKKVIFIILFTFLAFINFLPSYVVIYTPIMLVLIYFYFQKKSESKLEIVTKIVYSIVIVLSCYLFYTKSLKVNILEEFALSIIVYLIIKFQSTLFKYR